MKIVMLIMGIHIINYTNKYNFYYSFKKSRGRKCLHEEKLARIENMLSLIEITFKLLNFCINYTLQKLQLIFNLK